MQTKIFLVGLNVKFSEEKILNFFKKKYNSSVQVNLVYKKNKQHKTLNSGYGTILVNDPSQAEQLLNEGEFVLDGRRFFSKPYLEGKNLKKFKNGVKKKRVFIHNVDPKMNNITLRQLFSKYAQIEDAYLVERKLNKKRTGRKGANYSYGYVMFKHTQDAQNMIRKGTIKYRGSNIIILPFEAKDFHTNTRGNNPPTNRNNHFNSELKQQQRRSNYSGYGSLYEPNRIDQNSNNFMKVPLKFSVQNGKFNHYHHPKYNHKGQYQEGLRTNGQVSPIDIADKRHIKRTHLLASLWSGMKKETFDIRDIVRNLDHSQYNLMFCKENKSSRNRRINRENRFSDKFSLIGLKQKGTQKQFDNKIPSFDCFMQKRTNSVYSLFA